MTKHAAVNAKGHIILPVDQCRTNNSNEKLKSFRCSTEVQISQQAYSIIDAQPGEYDILSNKVGSGQ